jgi:hypothetical protein
MEREREELQPQVVYEPPGGGPGSHLSSLAAVRGPGASAATLDGAPLAEERTQRPRLAPSGTGPHSEPFGMLDLQELPETYGVDEVEVMYKDPWWAFVYWEVTEGGLAAARSQLGPAVQSARLVLRCFSTSADGVQAREIRDLPITWNHGRRYLDVPRPGSLLRVAVGLLTREGYFATIAHSSTLRLPPPQPGPPSAVEWMHVQPPRGRGEQRERLTILGRVVPHVERGLRWRVASAEEGGGDSPWAEVIVGLGPHSGGSGSGGGR